MTEYQHRPDQGPGGDRQFLIYLFLAFVLLLVFEGLFVRAPQKGAAPAEQKPAAPASSATTTAGTTAAAATGAPATRPAAATPAKKPKAAPALKPVRAASEQQMVVENELYRVTFSNRGAQVTSWLLKKYQDANGKPLDLVNPQAAAKFGLPLSLWSYDQGLRTQLSQALYLVTSSGGPHLAAPATLSFEYAEGGLEVRKSFRFDHSYVIEVETSVSENGQPVEAYPAWPSGFGDQTTAAGYGSGRVDWEDTKGVTHTPAFEHNVIRPSKWVSNGETLRDAFNWVGVSDQYFAALFMPALPAESATVTLNQAMELPKNPGDPNDKESVKVQALGIAVGNPGGPTRLRLFVGPKAMDVLGGVRANSTSGGAAAGPKLQGAIDFGFWGIFAKWLFLWLNWTHDHWISNWGWAIIVLTFIINGVVLPLRLSQMRTSLRMQKVQPRVQDINKKYQKYGLRDQDKQREKQAEIMALYKEEGINPMAMGSCLFALIQLPLIYAFYEVLESAIELRHANWLWIPDLTAPDPLHILPLLCIITMVAVQYMTPMPGMDKAQRNIMNVSMVGMFGWFTWLYSAGVAVYLTVSYFISAVQQYLLNRSQLGREIRELQEKRARKQKK